MGIKENYLIYVVDHDAAYTEQVKQYLHNSAHAFLRVRSFSSPDECAQHAGQRPDLILLEHLPAAHGVTESPSAGQETLKKIKDSFEDTPVVILTRNNNLGAVVKSMRSGAHSYIIKNREAFGHLGQLLNKLIARTRKKRQEQAMRKVKLITAIIIASILIFLLIIRNH
jgi:DNA-binding NarL/FixJ family response regulator